MEAALDDGRYEEAALLRDEYRRGLLEGSLRGGGGSSGSGGGGSAADDGPAF